MGFFSTNNPPSNFLVFPGWDLPPIPVGRQHTGWTEGGVVCLFLPSSNQPTNGTYRSDLAVHFTEREKKRQLKVVCLCSRNQIKLEMHLGWIAWLRRLRWNHSTFRSRDKDFGEPSRYASTAACMNDIANLSRAHVCQGEREENLCLRDANFSSRSAIFNFLECWVFRICSSAPSDH